MIVICPTCRSELAAKTEVEARDLHRKLSAPIDIVKGMLHHYEELRKVQPQWGNHVRAAEDILKALEVNQCQ